MCFLRFLLDADSTWRGAIVEEFSISLLVSTGEYINCLGILKYAKVIYDYVCNI